MTKSSDEESSSSSNVSSSRDGSSSSSDEESSLSKTTRPLTASELMQRKLQHNGTKKVNEPLALKRSDDDIDDEIERLEAELAQGSSGSDSDSDDASSESSSSEEEEREDESGRSKKRIKFGEATILNSQDEEEDARNSGGGIICLSECASESIVPLPKTLLPTSKTKKLKIDRVSNDNDNDNDNDSVSGGKKRKRSRGGNGTTTTTTTSKMNDGLRDAVKEVLSGYVARSSERIPFYCRVCSHQSDNHEDFVIHKRSEFHKAAVAVEKKATYCKLCRKQLTSIVQMQEHLESKPHRDRMDQVKARQRGRGGFGNMAFRGGRGGGFRGRGGGGRWHGSGGRSEQPRSRDKRQWC